MAVQLSVHGKHQIQNALAALLTAKLFGVSLQDAANRLSEFQGFSHRQQIFYKNGYTLIDDTYNASLTSMKAAIDILQNMKASHRVAILADMKELGEEEIHFHREIGEYLASAKNIQELWYYGTLAKEMASAFAASAPGAVVREFANLEELKDYALHNRKPDTAYLLKASNSMRLTEVADAMK